ncbi:hypothetical protein L2E82_35855 [Cichorium intybus]|uniref:Uncharacterized protein n=1 Tax=Cichorium intybus TaxID=13427 RepID=A0ACB9BQ41_CICIN|nr:hypothetical protein L2E82_35855 [Cichorium intybus]
MRAHSVLFYLFIPQTFLSTYCPDTEQTHTRKRDSNQEHDDDGELRISVHLNSPSIDLSTHHLNSRFFTSSS